MSDSEGDISDELLELAGATERKRRKRQAQGNSGTKRRKAVGPDEGSGAEQPESEEEERNPYPLEGKYVDETDRQRLMDMSEIEREDILAQRQEEMQRIQDKRNLEQMLKAQSGHTDDTVSRAARRQHPVRGATKEKTRKLDELRARRKEKDEKKRTRTNSPKRARSSSPADMDISDEDEEDGQISKYEEEEERDRRLYEKLNPEKEKTSEDETVTLEDFEKVRLSRDMVARLCLTPWFEETVKGAWVRYLNNQKDGQPVYRMFEVLGVHKNDASYEFNGRKMTTSLNLRYAVNDRPYRMDRISNSAFTELDFEEWKVMPKDKSSFPTKRELKEKSAQIIKNASRDMTESDINEMLARNMQEKSITVALAADHSRLKQMRMLAIRRQDWKEVEALDKQIAEVEAKMPWKKEEKRVDKPSREELLAEVNRRNRQANMEAVRQAELREAERKRRERKLLAAGGGASRSSTPKNGLRPFSSRPGTPATPADGTVIGSPLPPSALETVDTSTDFEASIIQSVDIDLGDF